jgi:arylsulfatase A-like enzyme
MHRPTSIALRVVLLTVCMLGCGEAATKPRHVVLISVDTLRADHLGAYGYDRPTSPSLDRVAGSGAQFLDASTTSPWTLPSHASLLTGLYPSHHGVKDHVNRLSDSVPTLASILVEHGYQTMAVINSHNLSRRYGLDRGFERFDYVYEWSGERGQKRKIVNRGAEITDRAIEWLKQRDERPFLLFLHYYDVHSDFAAQPEYKELFVRPFRGHINGKTRQLNDLRRREAKISKRAVDHLLDLYDAEIRQLDTTLQRLFDFIENAGLSDDVILIVTSDHGEEFMDHGSLLHGRTYYQEIMRVPLIFRGAGIERGVRIEDPVSLVDVVPTILGLLSLETMNTDASAFDGIDLSPNMKPAGADGHAKKPSGEDRLLFAEADHGNEEPDMKRMVRQGRFKLLFNRVTGESRLHDLLDDPDERHDIGAREPERAARFEQELQTFIQSEAEPEEIEPPDAEAVELLKELGYLR